jgi:hypothetical protein
MKGDIMNARMTRRTTIAGGFGLAVLAGLIVASAMACKAEKPAAPKTEEMLSMAALTPVFGNARDTKAGLADFTQSDTEIVLSYHLYLADLTNADKEIARDLAPKIRKLYGQFGAVDRVRFEVSLPDPSAPDDWNPYVSFVLTRKIVKETGWSNLLDTDLLSVAIDVKRAQ